MAEVDKTTKATDLSRGQKAKALIVFFGFFAAFVSLASYLLIQYSTQQRYFITFFMTAPGFAALIAAYASGINMTSIGLRLAPARQLFKSYGFAVFASLIAYIPVWLFFSNGYGSAKAAEGLAGWMSVYAWSNDGIFAFFTLLMLTIGVTQQILSTMGIEFAFRGLLASIVLPKLGFLGTAFLTGGLYAWMHGPVIFLADYNAGPKDLELQMLAFTISAIAIAVIALYYRLKTGSILPGALFHATIIATAYFAFDKATSKSAMTWRFSGEFGLMVPLVLTLLAFFFYRLARSKGYTALKEA